ncbi:MAG: hypothetical protein NXI00_16930 [Cytophagales bacterium]|nr:hypothetical protein [Cytophagales bacterium]
MAESISLLLGAGFSVPKGYPTAVQLNKNLLDCDDSKFGFSNDGKLVISKGGSKPDFGYTTSYDNQYKFCRDLIKYYFNEFGGFDYEKFYDFFSKDAISDPKVKELFKRNDYGYERDLNQLLGRLKDIYSQLVSYYLVDSESNSWYDNQGYLSAINYQGYTGFLNSLHQWSESLIIHVHSLNHDLFFDSLKNTEWLEGKMSDGFEDLGSPYYGELNCDGRKYKCRLERYTGKYDKKVRLYKLHGSKDYGIFYESKGHIAEYDNYIKTRWKIGHSRLYKEIENENGERIYTDSFINYHSDFLTGTTSKIIRYSEPFYNRLFNLFRENLKAAKALVIIGYGGRDTEINKIIKDNFDYQSKPSFIIDPYPGAELKSLKEQIGAELLQVQLEDVNPLHFDLK